MGIPPPFKIKPEKKSRKKRPETLQEAHLENRHALPWTPCEIYCCRWNRKTTQPFWLKGTWWCRGRALPPEYRRRKQWSARTPGWFCPPRKGLRPPRFLQSPFSFLADHPSTGIVRAEDTARAVCALVSAPSAERRPFAVAVLKRPDGELVKSQAIPADAICSPSDTFGADEAPLPAVDRRPVSPASPVLLRNARGRWRVGERTAEPHACYRLRRCVPCESTNAAVVVWIPGCVKRRQEPATLNFVRSTTLSSPRELTREHGGHLQSRW